MKTLNFKNSLIAMAISVIMVSCPEISFSQGIKEMHPELGEKLEFSDEDAAKFQKIWDELKKLNWNFSKLTQDKQDFMEKHGFSETFEDYNRPYWEVYGMRLLTHAEFYSWYGGGSQAVVSASSFLKSNYKTINYLPANIHDGSYQTAWVPGVKGEKGYSIGEYVTYQFNKATPGITRIKIANGYVKSEKAYRENSRPKKLKMYVNDVPFAILNLRDIRQEQIFEFDEPIGRTEPMEKWDELKSFHPLITNWANGNRKLKEKLEELKKIPSWTFKFEILEVYKGDKYDDTAITQIYFGGYPYGPQTLCLGAGSEILMADNTLKNIETINVGDWIKSYDFENQKLIDVEVTKLLSAPHFNLLKLKVGDNEIVTTADHPFWTEKGVWSAIDADIANSNYFQATIVENMKIGDKIFMPENNIFSEIIAIENIYGQQVTYTIELSENDNFIANGMLVKTEKPKTNIH